MYSDLSRKITFFNTRQTTIVNNEVKFACFVTVEQQLYHLHLKVG